MPVATQEATGIDSRDEGFPFPPISILPNKRVNAGKDLLCGDGGKEEAGQLCHDGETGAAEDFTDAVGHPEEGEDAEGGDEQGRRA